MSVGIDESGEKHGVAQVVDQGIGRCGGVRVDADGRDPPIGVDQNRGVSNGWGVDREYPAGTETKGSHHPPRKGLCRGQCSIGSVPG